jgi:Zn-dependent peptidase ImmA (M78 family)
MLKNGQIVINKQIAAQSNLNTMGHELLHKILKSEFSDPVKGARIKRSIFSAINS